MPVGINAAHALDMDLGNLNCAIVEFKIFSPIFRNSFL